VWNSVVDHNGKVTVMSNEHGTCFTLHFPVVERQRSQPIKEEEATVSAQGEHILIVDDEPMLREIATQILITEGYVIHSVSSGEEAIAFVKEKHVDLVLLDMFMDPGMNGRSTYEEILKFKPQQKALIISGYSESNDVKEAIQLGSGGYLKKPYTAKQLLKAVNEELARE
jgi:CheY-like chemotaxis protein